MDMNLKLFEDIDLSISNGLEIIRLESQINESVRKLNNDSFVSKAPKEIVKAEERKLNNFIAKHGSGIVNFKKDCFPRDWTDDDIMHGVQTIREEKQRAKNIHSTEHIFSREWFDYVYNEVITTRELVELASIYNGKTKKISLSNYVNRFPYHNMQEAYEMCKTEAEKMLNNLHNFNTKATSLVAIAKIIKGKQKTILGFRFKSHSSSDIDEIIINNDKLQSILSVKLKEAEDFRLSQLSQLPFG